MPKFYVCLTVMFMHCNWQFSAPLPVLPVLFYIVQVVNGSDISGSCVQLNTTNMNTTLKGIEPGHTYYIAVYAVNAVGDGSKFNITVTG